MADISVISPDGGTTELNIKDATARTNIGDLSALTTTAKTNLVAAVNEVAAGGGGGGTTDYTALSNKPQINSITLTGNKTSSDLGLTSETEFEDTLYGINLLETIEQGSLTSAGGINEESTSRLRVKEYIPVEVGKTYVFSGLSNITGASLQYKYFFYTVDDFTTTCVRFGNDWQDVNTTITVPAGSGGIKFVRLLFQLTGQSTVTPSNVSRCQFEEGSTATSYHPYNADAVYRLIDEIADDIPTVDQVYGASSTNAQSGTAVASAISTKADSSALDDWTSTATVDANNQVTFTGLNDAYGYSLYCNNGNLVGITAMEKTGSGTSVQIVFTLSNVSQGDTCKLRVLKG